MSFFDLLRTPCTIQGKTESQTTSGEVTQSWTDLADVMTRFHRNLQPFVTEEGYQVTTLSYKFYFDPAVMISEGHRIKVGTDIYEVLGVFSDSSGHHKEVFAKHVTLD